MEKKKILIVDDEIDFATGAKAVLEETGNYQVKIETKAKEALNTAREFVPDLLLLDLMMPEVTGFKVCEIFRSEEKFFSMPIIILSAQDEEYDKVEGLNVGADDYIVKPFSLNELDARIKAILRRAGQGEESKISIGDSVTIDLQRYEVVVEGQNVELTTSEFAILKLLSSKRGYVFDRSRILDYLWGEEKGVTERTVGVHIRHLRDKLGKSGDYIKCVRGIGYKLEQKLT